MNKPQQLPLDFEFRPAFGGADFLVTDSNREAVQWIDRWPDWLSPALVVYGPPASGKSHLAEVFRQKSQANVMTHQDLANDQPRDPAGAAGAWIIEDADRYLGDGPPEPLFHLFNQIKEGGGSLLLSGVLPPARWLVELADLSSRLNAAPTVGIGTPDDGLIGAVLVKLFADRQLRVSTDVIEYAVKRMERSLAAARNLVKALDALALAERREITVPLVRRVLAAGD